MTENGEKAQEYPPAPEPSPAPEPATPPTPESSPAPEPATPPAPEPSPAPEPATPPTPESSPAPEPATPPAPEPSPAPEPATPPALEPSPAPEPATPPAPEPSPAPEPATPPALEPSASGSSELTQLEIPAQQPATPPAQKPTPTSSPAGQTQANDLSDKDLEKVTAGKVTAFGLSALALATGFYASLPPPPPGSVNSSIVTRRGERQQAPQHPNEDSALLLQEWSKGYTTSDPERPATWGPRDINALKELARDPARFASALLSALRRLDVPEEDLREGERVAALFFRSTSAEQLEHAQEALRFYIKKLEEENPENTRIVDLCRGAGFTISYLDPRRADTALFNEIKAETSVWIQDDTAHYRITLYGDGNNILMRSPQMDFPALTLRNGTCVSASSPSFSVLLAPGGKAVNVTLHLEQGDGSPEMAKKLSEELKNLIEAKDVSMLRAVAPAMEQLGYDPIAIRTGRPTTREYRLATLFVNNYNKNPAHFEKDPRNETLYEPYSILSSMARASKQEEMRKLWDETMKLLKEPGNSKQAAKNFAHMARLAREETFMWERFDQEGYTLSPPEIYRRIAEGLRKTPVRTR